MNESPQLKISNVNSNTLQFKGIRHHYTEVLDDKENLEMPTPLSSYITISSTVLAQEVNGETVLFDMQSENYFGLNALGTRIWQLLQEKNELQKVYDAILLEYDVDALQLKKDLDELLENLINVGLITVE